MLGRNWSLVLRPLCRPQKNSKALRSVLKSDRFFFGVPKRLRKECLPLDLVFFLWLYSVILFFSSSLSKLEWSSVGNEGCLDVSCCRLWKPRLVSAALLSFPLFPWLFLTVYWWRQHQNAQVMQAFFLSPTKTLPSSLMDAKCPQLILHAYLGARLHQWAHRKANLGRFNQDKAVLHILPTTCFQKHHKSLLFSIVVEKKKPDWRPCSYFGKSKMFCFVFSFFNDCIKL